MKKVIAAVLIVLLLAVPLFACTTDVPPTNEHDTASLISIEAVVKKDGPTEVSTTVTIGQTPNYQTTDDAAMDELYARVFAIRDNTKDYCFVDVKSSEIDKLRAYNAGDKIALKGTAKMEKSGNSKKESLTLTDCIIQ